MSIAKLKLNESSKLEFGVAITGASGIPETRFVIEGKDFSVSFPCQTTNEGVEVDIHGLSNVLKSGEYAVRLEVILENKIYTPLIDVIEFEPGVEIQAKGAQKQIKESVQVNKIQVKSVINENELRKANAASIIASALHYHPEKKETPEQTIESALAMASSQNLNDDQMAIIKEMLVLAESMDIKVPNILSINGFSDQDIDMLVEQFRGKIPNEGTLKDRAHECAVSVLFEAVGNRNPELANQQAELVGRIASKFETILQNIK